MKALILNSGMGSRMGILTKEHPKCMTKIDTNDTIVSRQLKLIKKNGIKEVVMTTGYYEEVLKNYCNNLQLSLNIEYVNNPKYKDTNYIYSINCAKNSLQDDIILIHGDMVFSENVFKKVLKSENSCMTISSSISLPEKDFKAEIHNGWIKKIGIEFFNNSVAAQPLYKLKKDDWLKWLSSINEFCERGETSCYAENAFNIISDYCMLMPLDIKNELCSEIDNENDLIKIKNRLIKERENYGK